MLPRLQKNHAKFTHKRCIAVSALYPFASPHAADKNCDSRGVISLHCNSNTTDKNHAFIIASTAPTNENCDPPCVFAATSPYHRIAK